MPLADYYIKQGDTGLLIRSFCEDATGTPVDITGATVKFHMTNINGSATGALNASGTNENATSTGRVSYTFTAGQTANAGLYIAEWEITFGGGAIQTFPNGRQMLIRILPQIA